MGNSSAKPEPNPQPETKPIQSMVFPQPFKTEQEFISTWHLWKDIFMNVIGKIDAQNVKPNEQKYMLLNRMGSVALDICEKTNTSVDQEDLNSLLQIFDRYCAFYKNKRVPMENPYTYINELKAQVNRDSPEKITSEVKEKLRKEIDVEKFSNMAYTVLPRFVFDLDFKTLTLSEIAFIWQLCDISETKKIYKIVDCNSCGKNHTKNKCPVTGAQCALCKGFNHLSVKCPRNFIFDCRFCGSNHRMRNCPSYNNTCRRCNQQHHFVWKCNATKNINCRFCGTLHVASKSICPARNNFCEKCKTKGHFSFKCSAAGTN